MSRRSHRKRQRTRDIPTIASDTLSSLLQPEYVAVRSVSSWLQDIDDRRMFHPLDEFRPAKSVMYRDATQLVVPNVNKPQKQSNLLSSLPASVQFNAPHSVALCVRRKRRREVLFARGVGGGRQWKRRARWSEFSEVKC